LSRFFRDNNRSGEIIEITIRDFSGAKIDFFKFNIKDKRKAYMTLRILKRKYGFSSEEKDRDINWLKGKEY